MNHNVVKKIKRGLNSFFLPFILSVLLCIAYLFHFRTKELYILLFTSFGLCLLHNMVPKKRKVLLWSLGALFGGVMILGINTSSLIQVDQLFFPLVLVVLGANMPFLYSYKRENPQDLWTNGVKLLSNLTLAFLLSLVSYLGILLAFFAIKSLFHLPLPKNIEENLFYFSTFILCPLLFFSQINPYPKQRKKRTLSKVESIFIPYILLPINMVYFIILYAYALFILINKEIPQGVISYITLGFSLTTLITLFALENFKNKSFAKRFKGVAFCLLLPPQGLFFYAIITRIMAYGFTEKRVYLLCLALWISLISLWGIIQRGVKYSHSALSFTLLTLTLFLSPINLSTISIRSQEKRAYHILKGKPLNEEEVKGLSDKDKKEIYEVVVYLENHKISPSFLPSDKVQKDKILEILQQETEVKHYNYYLEKSKGVFNLPPFSTLITLNYQEYLNDDKSKGYLLYRDEKEAISVLLFGDKLIIKEDQDLLISIDFNSICNKFKSKPSRPNFYETSQRVYSFTNDRVTVNLILKDFSATHRDKEYLLVNSFSMILLLETN